MVRVICNRPIATILYLFWVFFREGIPDTWSSTIFMSSTFTHISLGALLETHIREPSLSPILNILCPSWSYASNHSSDPDGRIILIWKPSLNVTVTHQSRQSLTCRVTSPTVPSFYFTAVYAGNTTEERNELWVELLEVQTTQNLDSHPWLVGGDFNEIIHPSEHSSPAISQITTPMIDFHSCLNQPRSLARFLAPDISDHTPCCIELDHPLPQAGTKPFKFFNYLTLHPDFLTLVAETWVCRFVFGCAGSLSSPTQF